jgi:hypothetical protein
MRAKFRVCDPFQQTSDPPEGDDNAPSDSGDDYTDNIGKTGTTPSGGDDEYTDSTDYGGDSEDGANY